VTSGTLFQRSRPTVARVASVLMHWDRDISRLNAR